MPLGYGNPACTHTKWSFCERGAVVDSFTGKLGFREVELVQKPVSSNRMSFRLKVNGADVFVKGSNWVPCECFTGYRAAGTL